MRNEVISCGLPAFGRFARYLAAMSDRAWNLSIRAVYATRSYDAGVDGARRLRSLSEEFKGKLTKRRYELYVIRTALLELTCLDRLDRLSEYLELWEGLRRRPLVLFYHLSRRGDPRIAPFVLDDGPDRLSVHFLYLTWARKRIIEGKLGRDYKAHGSQEDLTEEEMRERLRRLG